MGDKIIKSKKKHTGKAKNMNFVGKIREEAWKIMQFKSSYKFFPLICLIIYMFFIHDNFQIVIYDM
jgi:hypothetical protein